MTPTADEVTRSAVDAACRRGDLLLSNVAHQLRNSLNAIVSWVYLLRSGQLDAAQTSQGLEALERSARAQEQLLERILDLSRLRCGTLRLASRQRVDLGLVVEATLAAFNSELVASGVQVESSLAPHCLVDGDAFRLQQMVAELLSNASKFAPAGKVEIRLEQTVDQVQLTVSDDGCGLAPPELAVLFDWTGRLLTAGGQRTDDLGIGLVIARCLLELHGGTLTATSRGPGFGATFTASLPRPPEVTDITSVSPGEPVSAYMEA